ncbi:hypothetical protein [Sphingomonas sp.]|uniref:hypothetical protein n=1 Tax=Sphingomonas sp. TaxID=28214 RepID=UPI002DD6A9A6|nr:hypothetical protein [Sphingomonas sp.]
MRKVLGILAGIIVAMLTVALVEFVGHRVYPPPSGMAMNDPAAVADYIAAMPAAAALFVVAAWFAGALTGGWTAIAITRWRAAAWLIGGLIAGAGIYNALQIPAPLWMQLSTVLAPALGAWAALHLPRPPA